MESAINSRIFEKDSIKGAKAVLVNFTCSNDTSIDDISRALSLIEAEADENANIIFGTVFDDSKEEFVKTTLVTTGLDTTNV